MASSDRRLVDRAMGASMPQAVESYAPPPREIADGITVFDRRLKLPGAALQTRGAVVALANGDPWVWSPLPLDGEIREFLDRLGGPAHLVAPNSFHYVFLRDHLDVWPRARLWLAPGLRERRPELPPGEELGEAPPEAWREEIDHCVFGPWRGLSELAFLHRATRTLFLTDVCFNIRSADSKLEEWFWRLNRAWNRFGPSATARMLLLRDPATVRDFARRVLEWDFDRIVVSHGDILESGGRAAFESAFARWLASGG